MALPAVVPINFNSDRRLTGFPFSFCTDILPIDGGYYAGSGKFGKLQARITRKHLAGACRLCGAFSQGRGLPFGHEFICLDTIGCLPNRLSGKAVGALENDAAQNERVATLHDSCWR
jgi:hypothetical protein